MSEMLADILREWDKWIHGSREAYFDNWPDFLNNELRKRGLYIVRVSQIPISATDVAQDPYRLGTFQ